ncbi:DMT family transporter [Vibrio bathopelagicus]|uniref:DMT family transporter n=1 Tax=Vibrio bathopelagicus TaxID=2777577 RepID=UPI0018643098|nr:DMT family transporter [Vibrio bathopelagicus]
MSNVTVGILLLIAGNLFASLSDVAVKLLNGEVPALQYIFFRQLISLLIITPLWLQQKKEQRRLQQAKVTIIRGQLILIGSGCMVVAITHLSLATANAVFYVAPLLMLPLSMFLLKEQPALGKVIATTIGFVGALIVLRPSQFHGAALFALGTALTLALFNVLVRKLPSEQSVVTTLWWTTLFSIPASLVLCFLYWQPVSAEHLGYIVLSATLILSYNGLAVSAYQKAHSSQIALAEYSGLVFVALIGAIWFDEIPDTLTFIGIMLIILPLAPFKRPKKRANT